MRIIALIGMGHMAVAIDIMESHFVGISETAKVSTALKLSESAKVDIMPVLSNGRLCGIVFKSDLEAHAEQDCSVSEVMKNVVFVEKDTQLQKITQLMVKTGLGRIPVVDSKRSMNCIGIVTSTDVLRALK